jgi:hypothetical protein
MAMPSNNGCENHGDRYRVVYPEGNRNSGTVVCYCAFCNRYIGRAPASQVADQKEGKLAIADPREAVLD